MKKFLGRFNHMVAVPQTYRVLSKHWKNHETGVPISIETTDGQKIEGALIINDMVYHNGPDILPSDIKDLVRVAIPGDYVKPGRPEDTHFYRLLEYLKSAPEEELDKLSELEREQLGELMSLLKSKVFGISEYDKVIAEGLNHPTIHQDYYDWRQSMVDPAHQNWARYLHDLERRLTTPGVNIRAVVYDALQWAWTLSRELLKLKAERCVK